MKVKTIHPSSKYPLLVFGGVYSNLQALQKLRYEAELLGVPPGNILSTGDNIAYCAQPVECIQLLSEWGIHSIAGNVELQVVGEKEDCGCNFSSGGRCDIFSRRWYPFLQNKLGEEEMRWLAGLPEFLRFSYNGKLFLVLHGSLNNTSEYIFCSTSGEIKNSILEAAGADVILAGHCGIPFHSRLDKGHWVNAGAAGMPANDGNPRTWYIQILTSEIPELRFKSLDYDYAMAVRMMREHHLPEPYAQTLESGIWDNCEILPDFETRQQGQPLQLEGALLV